jgi:phage-related protein
MICVDPWIWSLAPVTETLAAGWTSRNLPYTGSKSAGFQMTLLVKTATSQIVLDLDGKKMTLTKAFAVNDVITINTSEGSRYIRQNGSDIMVTLSSTSEWLRLRKGNPNLLKVHGGVENDGKVTLTTYVFQDAWWGI